MSAMPAPALVIVLTTVGVDADAAALGRRLVDARLAACVNVLSPMTSIYRWRSGVEDAREQQLVIKTTPALVPALEARLREWHPYELPEFVVLTAQGSDDYRRWVEESVG